LPVVIAAAGLFFAALFCMRLLIPVYQGRVSPLFDVARQLLLVDMDETTEFGRRVVEVEETALVTRAQRIASLGPQVLICGAISRSLEAMLTSAGIRVIPNTCGPVEEVLGAFVSGQFGQRSFLMPGCRGRRRRFRGRYRRRGRGR
jgi:predicted Fe-Mo cluster-binding NifX family protein